MAHEYEFGPFRLDVAERRLLREGRVVPLQDKLFDMLVMLVRNAGRLLEKDAIMRTVWPDAHVEETNLPHSISMLRKVLDDGLGSQYVETIPKHGYRFVAQVRECEKPRHLPEGHGQRAKPAVPATRYARAGDVTVAYQVLGDGPIDLVYVPGWITHLEYRWEQPRAAHLMRRLASFSRLIVFDKRGTGLSDRTYGYPTLDDRIDDVSAVMDAVNSERAVVFGVSEGGGMASVFAASHPERTAALVLYGTFAKRAWSPDYPWAPTAEARQRWYDLLQNEWGGKTDLETLAPSAAHEEAFVEWWSTYLRLGASPGAAMALARFNTQIDTRHVLPAIQVPTLVLHRTGDVDVNVEEARYLARHIPAATLVELPGIDHLIYAGDIDRLADEIHRFVSRLHTSRPVERVLSTIAVFEAGDCPQPELPVDVDRRCAAHRGKVLRSTSTRLFASFDGPGHAIRAACDIVSDGGFRAGIHTGECEMNTGSLEGLPFAIASTLAATAEPGRVLVTRTVTDLVAGSRFGFAACGTRPLGEAGTWAIYEVRIADA